MMAVGNIVWNGVNYNKGSNEMYQISNGKGKLYNWMDYKYRGKMSTFSS